MPVRPPVRASGFTLIELMVAIAIVGVLAALAIVGVRRYVLTARTAEPRNALGQMAKDAEAAYSRETMAATLLSAHGTSAASAALCSSASTTVPANVARITGRKYQSSPSDWTRDQATANKGFACLRFSMSDPQYYLYAYARPTGAVFTARANGDLDGDNVTSTFELYGSVYSASKAGKAVFIAPNIAETAPEE